MSRIKLGIRRISPAAPVAAVRRKRVYVDKVDWAPLVARTAHTDVRTGLRSAREAAYLRLSWCLRRKRR